MAKESYHLTYTVEPHPVAVMANTLDDNVSACDSVVIASIVDYPDGSTTTLFWSLDGKTGEQLPMNVLYQNWILMANMLASAESLPACKRMACVRVVADYRQLIHGPKSPHANNCSLSDDDVETVDPRRDPDE
jgi:hypothetical protein